MDQMGLFSIGITIAKVIDRNYTDHEFTAAVMMRELITLENFFQLKPRFTDNEWELIMVELLDFYYTYENIGAQSIAWALRDLIQNARAITFKFTEDGIVLHPDYEPDSVIKFQDALWEEIIAFD
jgi:hypothetical protein